MTHPKNNLNPPVVSAATASSPGLHVELSAEAPAYTAPATETSFQPLEPLSEQMGPGKISEVNRRAVNATAYRIFKLLQWLIESPQSVEDLNSRFASDPAIGKILSTDSIWLYINTLKELGCQIRRPSQRTGFCYELLYHPFGLPLSDGHLEMLAQVKAYAQRQLNHQDILVLDRLLKKIIAYSACAEPAEVVERLFAQSRSFDYGGYHQQLAALEQGLPEDSLWEITYLSPLKGSEVFVFLPESLYYRQGVLYVRGERPEFKEPSSLRLDRIQALHAVENPDLREALLKRRTCKTAVVMRIYVPEARDFTGLGLETHDGVYDERLTWQEVDGRSYYQVSLQVRDFFYLKQRLLSGGFDFSIQAPAAFREDVLKTLNAMRALYVREEAGHGA